MDQWANLGYGSPSPTGRCARRPGGVCVIIISDPVADRKTFACCTSGNRHELVSHTRPCCSRSRHILPQVSRPHNSRALGLSTKSEALCLCNTKLHFPLFVLRESVTTQIIERNLAYLGVTVRDFGTHRGISISLTMGCDKRPIKHGHKVRGEVKRVDLGH